MKTLTVAQRDQVLAQIRDDQARLNRRPRADRSAKSAPKTSPVSSPGEAQKIRNQIGAIRARSAMEFMTGRSERRGGEDVTTLPRYEARFCEHFAGGR